MVLDHGFQTLACLELLEGLLKQITGLWTRGFDSVGLGFEMGTVAGICISRKSPGDTQPAALGTSLWEVTGLKYFVSQKTSGDGDDNVNNNSSHVLSFCGVIGTLPLTSVIKLNSRNNLMK